MMKLVFQQQYKSIGALVDPPELPKFSIVTGVNGSGKTHLLEAIEQSKVHIFIDDVAIQASQIRSFNWQTLDVGQTGPVDYSARVNFMDQFWLQTLELKQLHSERLRTRLVALGVEASVAGLEALFEIAGEMPHRDDPEVRALLQQINHRILGQLQGNTAEGNAWQHRIDLETLTPAHPGLAVLGRTQFRHKLVNSPMNLDPFRQQLSALFVAYRKAEESNSLRLSGHRKGLGVSTEDFVHEYGSPPWELLNEMLSAGGYGFRVNHPDDEGPFEVEIQSTFSAARWNFGDLSSGEKVLISFLMASYTIQNGFAKKQVPKVLLLDEVDAPLHPTMIDRLLRVVNEVLVEGQDVHCIMTTHNPATIALARSASYYTMSQNTPRLTACTREEAIDVLSVGLPALSVAVENRRVVWVESDYDVVGLELITSSLKSQIDGPFVPTYLSVGFKAIQGQCDSEQSGGKARVTEIVKSLHASGVNNVRGIVDSDGTGASLMPPGVFRLTDGERYSIENVLLDPLLIGMLVVRERVDCNGLNRNSFGVSELGTFGGLDLNDSVALQGVVDKVLQAAGVPAGINSNSGFQKIVLVNDAIVELPRWVLEIQGHAWCRQLFERLPCLKRWKTEPGLMAAVARTVLADQPGLLTKAAAETIQRVHLA
jgi:hypothetical protein